MANTDPAAAGINRFIRPLQCCEPRLVIGRVSASSAKRGRCGGARPVRLPPWQAAAREQHCDRNEPLHHEIEQAPLPLLRGQNRVSGMLKLGTRRDLSRTALAICLSYVLAL